jgi:hypothetical protein
MDDASAPRTIWIVLAVLAGSLGGAVGLAVVGEVLLLRARPRTGTEAAWRLAGLTSLTTAFVTGLLGGLVGLVVGLHAYAPTAFFAFVEAGAAAGAVGALVGAGVGAVLAMDERRRWRTS